MQENKKSRKWLWIVIAIVAVLAVVGVVLGIILSGPSDGPGGQQGDTPKGGRAEIYWNIDRALYSDPATGMSARKPEADGTYKVTFAYEGEQKEYTISDKRLVNYIDTADVMGLEFDENGQIVDAINVTNLATEVAKNFYVLKVEGNVITLNGSATFDGMAKTITCEELTKIYDLSGPRETKGEIIQPEDLQPLDTVLVYGNDMDQVTHIGVMVRPPESAIYWRAEQYYSYVLDTMGTTREPDENGIYTVEMFSNGELVSLKFRNKEDVNNVDKVMANHAHFGLIFDEEGYVIGTQPSQNGIRGRVACNQYDVTSVDGRSFVATGVVDTNYIGYTYEGTVPEGVGVYDVSWRYNNKLRGKDVGMVNVGDRITVWEDTLGNIVEIYIYIRKVPGPICYRMDNLINRQPDAKGWYTFEMLIEGKVKTVKTKNEEIARFLEGNAYVALDLDGNVIKEAYDYTQVVMRGYTDMVKQGWSVANVAGLVVTLENPTSTTISSKIVSPNLKVYNVSGVHQKIGAETELRVGDRGNFISDATGQLVYAIVTSRMVDADVYFNLTVKYDNRNKCTARVPDENGYYVFDMAHGGKQVTVKTKSKAVASAIDAIAHQVVALKPDKNGVVKEAFPGDYATGGVVRMGGDYTFEGYTEDGQMQFARKVTPDVKVYYNPADKIKTYNVSQVGFKKFRGEEDKFEVGDQALIVTNIRNKVEYFFIVSSDAKTITQYCPHCKKKVAFEPWIGTNLSFRDGKSGHIYLPGNGQDLPCSILGDHPNERAMDLVIDLRGNTARFEKGSRGFIISNYIKLSIMDSKGGGRMIGTGVAGEAAGLIAGNNNSTINLYGGSLEAAKDHSGIALGGAVYVGGTSLLNVYGGKIYSADKTLEALYVDTGATVNIKNGANIGSMSVAPNTTLNLTGKITIGKLMPLMNRLIDFTKLDKKSSIGIVARGPFTTEMSNPKAYLGMFNCPVKGGSIVVEGNQLACYGTEPDLSEVYELSKDMDFSNTKKLPRYCPKCDKNVIWQPLPEQDSKTSGANHLLPGNAHYYVPKGGITISNIYALNSGDVCLHLADQTITNDTVEAFAVFGGKTLTIMGDGKMKSTCKGGIASILYNAGTVNICGGTYESTRTDAQPIVCNLGSTGNLINLYDGTLKHKSVALNTKMETANIFGGTVEGTVMTQANGTLSVSGGKLEVVKIAKDSEFQLSGKPVIKKLTLLDGALAQVGKLVTGASIKVNADGIFTTDFASVAAANAAIKYFAGMEEGALIKRDGKALTSVPAPFDYKKVLNKINTQSFTGNAAGDAGYCYHCKENVTWMPITKPTYINGSGHYYLAKNITNAADSTIVLSKAGGQNVCLHLNGKTIENTGAACSAILLWGAENKLNLMGDGIVKNKSANWAAFESKQNVVNNIYGGTFINESGNARAVQVAQGTTYIYGATIENSYVFGVGGTTVVEGGTCYGVNDSVAGKIVLKDVAVTDATITTGTLELDGATVENLRVTATATALKISGKTVINNLNMNEAVIKAEIGQLVTGAAIKVNANGIFTTDFASKAAANAAIKYFAGVEEGAQIKRDGKALTSVPAPFDYKKVLDKINAQTFTGNASGDAGYCYHCKGNVTWMPITEPTYINGSGHYYLAKNITNAADSTIVLSKAGGQNVCLHLNGKTIENTGAACSAILLWGAENKLNLMGDGIVKNKSANWAAFESKPNVVSNIYGGTFINESGNARAVQVANGTTYIYGATIENSYVFGVGGTTVVEGGTCYGVNDSVAGKIVLKDVAVTDATVTTGTLELDGATVENLKVTATATALKISGKTVIDNLNMNEAVIKAEIGELTTGADIKVNAKGIFTTEFADEDAAEAALQYFTAAARGADVTREGKALLCAAMTPMQIAEEAKKQTFTGTSPVTEYCYVCGVDATWQPITEATTIAAGGHYFLANDVTASGTHGVNTWGFNSGTACLHLNGKTLKDTVNGFCGIIKYGTGTLNVMGGGRAENASAGWGALENKGGTMNVYGITAVNTSGGNHGVLANANTTTNLYGVDVSESLVTAAGGTLNIDSGSFKKINITGCQVSLSGAPTVAALDMSAATTKINAKGLTGGSINVSAVVGVFTTPFDSDTLAKAAIPFFVTGSKTISATDEYALKCEAKTYDPANTIAEKIEKSNAQRFEGTAPVEDYCYVCNQPVTWQPITEAATINTAGHYFLTNDVTTSGTHGVNTWGFNTGVACLHLNGKTLKDTENGYSGIIKYGTGTLNVMGGGRAENASAGWGALETKVGTMNVYGITAVNTSGGNHGVIVNANTTMNLYGVNVSESLVTAAGGNLNIDSGNYKRINVTGCAVNVAGAPVIANLDMNGATTKLTVGELITGADIKVSANDVFTTEFADEAAAEAALQYFTAAARGANVTREGKALLCAAMTPMQIAEEANKQTFTGTEPVNEYCYVCGTDATWQPITEAATINTAGHYFLANDVTADGAHGVNTWGFNSGTACLHLNGKTLKDTKDGFCGIIKYGTGTLNVMGGGRAENASAGWGALETKVGTMNVYGITAVNTNGGNHGVMVNANTTMNLYGVNVSESQVTAVGGNLNIDSGNYKRINVTGCAVNVAGTPVIANLDMNGATTKLTVGELITGADIKVSANDVFTTEFVDEAAAEAALQYFTAAARGANVTREGKTLICAAMTPVQIAEEAKKQTFTGTEPVTEYCYVCGADATWHPITAATHIASNGHYFLANDITSASSDEPTLYTWGPTTFVCLHLNGKKVEHTNQLAAVNNMKPIALNVMGNGSLVNASSNHGTVVNSAAGSVNLYGTTVANGAGHQYGFTLTNGTMNLYNVSAESGAVHATTGTVNIDSGKIMGVTVTAGQVSVAGAPEISNLDMSAATTRLTVGKLVTGADIKVNANGVFTGDIADVNAAEAAFSAVAADKTIAIVGQTLSCVNAG